MDADLLTKIALLKEEGKSVTISKDEPQNAENNDYWYDLNTDELKGRVEGKWLLVILFEDALTPYTIGEPGLKGEDGKDGATGEKGDKGDKGDTGPQGPKGDPGIPGHDGESIQGEKGDPGLQGPPGEDGIDGINGENGKDGKDSTVPGPKGEKGSQGDKGDPGEGVPPGGKPGQVLSKATSEDYDTIWRDIPRPVSHVISGGGGGAGTPGPAGPQGIQGLPGANGANGTDGVDGPQGLQGIQGIQGPAGTDGTDGADGIPTTVTDTTTVNLTLTGNDLSADVIPGGVNHNDLAAIDGGTAGEYNHLTDAEYTALTDKILKSLLTEAGSIITSSAASTPVELVHPVFTTGAPYYLRGASHGNQPTWGRLALSDITDFYTALQEQGDIMIYTGAVWTYLHHDVYGAPLLSGGHGALPFYGTPDGSNNATLVATTTASKGGVFNGDFELVPPFVAVQIASNWIDGTALGSSTVTQYGWYGYIVNAGNFAFDTTISHSGKASIRVVSTTAGANDFIGIYNCNGAIGYESKYIVPIKGSTRYKFSCWIKTSGITTANSKGAHVIFYDLNSTLSTLTLTSSGYYTGTTEWTLYTITFTSGVTAAYWAILQTGIIGETGTAWFDDIKLEEVIEDTGYTGTVPTPLLSTITGVTSTDSVDQSLDPTFAATYHYDLTNAVNEGATHRQTFTPTRNHVYSIKVKTIAKGTGNWTLAIHDAANNVISSCLIANASLANNTITEFIAPELWTAGALHFHLYSSVADGTVVVGTADHDLETCSYIQYYAKPTENATIICNGERICLSADQDGILGGAIIDLDKGKYLYNPVLTNSGTSFANDVYSAILCTWNPAIINGWYNTSGVVGGGVNNPWIILKVNTILPLKDLTISATFGNNANNVGTIQVSADNINYTDIANGGGNSVQFGKTSILNGLSTFYVKLIGTYGGGAGYLVIYKLLIEADLDTSALQIPQIYPLSTNQFSDDIILPSVASRVYFRLNKYSNSNGVVVPHLEFTDASAVYIKPMPIRIDNSQETNPAIAIVVADTTYGQASGTGSAEGGNYILNDGEYMTFSTATAAPKVTYLVGKGTTAFTNITKNVIYLSSNGSSNYATKDPSHQMSVTHWYRIQSLAKTVNDVVRKVSDIANSLIPNSSFDIQFLIDGGGLTPSVASKGFITVPSKCVVTGWTLLGDAAGTIVVDVHSCAYSGFPTTTTIWSSKPTIAASAQMAQTLGTLSIPLNKGDVLEIAVDSVTTITRCTLSMHCERVK